VSRDSVHFGYLHIAGDKLIIIKRRRFWFHGLSDVATFQKTSADVLFFRLRANVLGMYHGIKVFSET
jgi:hypothetical protein